MKTAVKGYEGKYSITSDGKVYSDMNSIELKQSIGTTGYYRVNLNNKDGIRKLTPLECERLQTLPDNYTAGISDTQRYKCLGNGWTVNIIAHIFKNII